MNLDRIEGINNPLVLRETLNERQRPVTNRVIEPAHNNAFFTQRRLKPYEDFRLKYAMSAITNGPHLTSGVPGEVTPKRGVMNNL